MKIRQVVRVKKGEEEIYNDGNTSRSALEESSSKYVEHLEFSKENETALYIKPNIKKETNIDKSSFPPNIHKEITLEEIDGTLYKVSADGDVEVDDSTLKKNPTASNRDIIKSKIDGALDWTNVQDKNLSWDKNKDEGENWSDLSVGLAQQATGSLGNMIGLSNSDLSDLAGGFNSFGKDSLTRFDTDATKLNEWKSKKFKEIHVHDWKPGQTLTPGLLDGSLGDLVEDIGNSSAFSQESRDSFNKGYNTLKEIISPDPVKTIRDAIKPTKGIFGDAETIGVQNDTYAVEYSPSDSGTVSMNWSKNSNFFSELNKSEKEIRIINALKNKNTFNKTLGSIYIRPNCIYDGGDKVDSAGMKSLEIPFEFNPTISEGATQANYAVETLMNRIGQFHIYTGTNLSTLSIELSYMALAPDILDDEDKRNISKQFSTDSWQYYWTNNRIEEIEYKLRSLVMPDVVSKDYLVRPPLIELHLGNPNGEGAETVGDLFKYPIGINDENDKNNTFIANEKKYLATSRTVVGGGVNRYKKYIVTSVQISNLNDDSFIWPSLYGRVWDINRPSGSPINHIKTASDLNISSEGKDVLGFNGYTRRTGFKASLQCTEVTENFLDIVPDFKAYYDAWRIKGDKAENTSKYVKYVTGEEIQKTTDLLDGALNTAAANISNLNEKLDAAFNEAYILAKVYKNMMDDSKRTNAFACQALSKENEKNNKMEDYYFANPKWIDELKEEGAAAVAEAESSEGENNEEIFKKPVYFKVKMKSDLKNFLDKANLKWEEYSDQNFIGKHFTIENTSIERSENKLSNKINFFPSTDNSEIDKIFEITGLFNEGEKSVTNKILLHNNDLSLKEYTDTECIVLFNYILNFCVEYKKRIGEISIQFPNDIENYIKKIVYNKIESILSGSDFPEIDNKYNICYEDMNAVLASMQREINKYYNSWDNALEGVPGLDKLVRDVGQAYDQINKHDEGFKIGEEIKKELNIKYSVSDVACNDESYSREKIEKTLFENFYNDMKEDGIHPLKISTIFKHAKEILLNYCDYITSIKKTLIDIVDYELMSIKNSSINVLVSIIASLISGRNVYHINKTTKKIKYSSKHATGKNFVVFDKDVSFFETCIDDHSLFSISYIINCITDSYKDSIDEIDKMSKEAESLPQYNISENVEMNDNFNSIRDIKFKKDNYLQKEILKVIDIFEKININNDSERNRLLNGFLTKDIKECFITDYFYKGVYSTLIYNTAGLKFNINLTSIQNNFNVIAGYDSKSKEELEKENPNIKYVQMVSTDESNKGLDQLKDAYEDYSSSPNSIRKIYKKFEDVINGTDKGINLGDYSEDNENTKSGKIPNLYFQINKATEMENDMQVAGSAIKGFDKLT